ncbi:MAG: AbrB/MazE/SpoVT family DNA-binding domain-containing protein [Propionibacteriaceae bacterium]|nr:AbrB/MazE/SpoVT family DNA-binding domain-containing protein [Propionibacteriaceae bacterium]
MVIPEDIRAAHGLKPGDPLAIFSTQEGMVLMTMDQLEERVESPPPSTAVNLLGQSWEPWDGEESSAVSQM